MWLLAQRPGNRTARAVALVAVVLFLVGGLVASSIAGGCIGIGPAGC